MIKKSKEQEVFYEVDSNDVMFCYIWLEKFHPILKRTIKYRVDFDFEDLAFVKSHRWFIHDWGYAFFPLQVNGVTVKTIYMHRQIAQHLLEEGQVLGEVDHKNWNKLNNRRKNLRVVNRRENMNNMPPRSPFGRHYIQVIHDNLYHAYAPSEDDTLPAVLLGGFATREEAIEAQQKYIQEMNNNVEVAP